MNNVSHPGARATLTERLAALHPPWVHRLGYYGLALLFVAAAATLRWALPGVLGPVPALVFYLAWVGAATLGGLGPGLLATVASWLCMEVLFDYTPGQSLFNSPEELGRFLVLMAGGLAVSLIADRMRRGIFRERRLLHELGVHSVQLQEGNEQLAASNEELRATTEELHEEIEDRKKAEAALRESEDRFRTMANAIPQLAWIAHADGFIYWYNRRWYDYTGTTPEQMEGWGWQSVHDPRELPQVLERWKSSIATGQPFDMIFPLRGADGVLRPFLTRVMPLKDEQGRVQQWFGTNTDVSEQKRAEEAIQEANENLAAVNEELAASNEELRATTEELQSEIEDRKKAEATTRESEDRYRSLFDNMLNGLAFCRMLFVDHRPVDFTYLAVNRAFESLTGLKNIIGKNVSEVIPGIRATNPEMFEIYGRVAATGRPEQFETYVEPLAMWFSISVYCPRPEYFVAVFDVITERKHAEAVLRDLNVTLESKVAQRTAELAYRAKQLQKLTLELTQAEERERRRIAVILHEDLQQQIAGATFHLSLAKGRTKDDRVWAEVEEAEATLKAVIERSRSLSRDLSPPVVRMNDLAEVLPWLADRVREQQGLKVQVSLSGDMVLHSEALAAFLFRAAQEMLFNVVKHARVREAALRVRRIGHSICLSVSDQGRGFDPQELKHTFGVGLFSIRERTELLGGRMKIRSAKGKGSRFDIMVPDSPKVERTREIPTSEAGLAAESMAVPSSRFDGGLRVLLVDDHTIVRQGLAALIQETSDIQVVGEAPDGREAINLAIDLRPDVVIMDVSMPVMSGDQATRQIKTYLPGTRVIAFSMYDEAEKRRRMFEAGAESYMLKTASTEELLAAIRGADTGGN